MIKKLFTLVTKLTVARPERIVYEAGQDIKATASQDSQPGVAIFIHPKALTFPILVVLVKAAWTAATLLPISWAASIWLPFGLCMLLGLLVTISNLAELQLRPWEWLTGLLIGALNSLVVFAAVVGATKAQVS